MRYRDFTIALSETRAAGDELELRIQVTEAAGLPVIIEPVRATCDLRLARLLADGAASRRCGGRAQLQAGEMLGRALLPGPVLPRFREALSVARSREEGLRLRILGGDAVHALPWEYALLAPEHGEATEVDFLALMPDVSLVRDQSIPRVAWAKATLPIRIFATAAHPAHYAPLALGQERASLERALRGLGSDVSVQWSPRGARPSAAHKAQLFHFAGHGLFEEVIRRAPTAPTLVMPPSPGPGGMRDVAKSSAATSGEGSLVFARADGSPDLVSAGQLGVILREMGVRVAVLNACRTATRDGARAWSSVAAALLKAGVRSVVAMQHEIYDASAVAFATAFYRVLAIGGSLDQATRSGRMAIFDHGDAFGWGTPVLYLCGPDGVIFPEAERVAANRTTLQQLEQRELQSYRARSVVPGSVSSPPPAAAPAPRVHRPTPVAMSVSCTRCGKIAPHEPPRRYDVEVIYFCESCRNALLAAPPLPPGYLVVHELRRGETGAVYRVTHASQRECTLRLILPRAAVPRATMQAWTAESSLRPHLRHVHLVSVLASGEAAPGVTWVATELLSDSLGELRRRYAHGVDPRHVRAIGMQLLDAVGYLHHHQVTHQAIRPSKVLITRGADGLKLVKLDGVGWAAAYRNAGAGGAAAAARLAPQERFLAPEARGEAGHATVAADLYSVAAVLLWLLGGTMDVGTAPVPAKLAAVLEHAMQREPGRRFRSAAEMQLALRSALDEPELERVAAQG